MRQLILSGQRGVPLTRTEPIENEFCPQTIGDGSDEENSDAPHERPSLAIHGTNPLFGTELSTITTREFPSGLKHEVYDPLRTVSTLAYDRTHTRSDATQYEINRLIAVEPPASKSLFVTAIVNRSR